jgi:GT2 family glycosyltransferase
MITVIYSTHKDKKYNEEFKKHLVSTVGIKNPQILEFENFGQYSLAEVYNKGIEMSEHNIVCCIHNDIKLEKGWGKKLLQEFHNNTDYGIIGKAGSCYFPESGVYWERMNQTMVGQVYHHPEGQKKWLNQYSATLPILIPVVTIDGLFISFDKTKIKHKFDETIGKFHFYDHGFCVPNYLDEVKIGVTSSFEITHQSVGQPNEEFFQSKDKFLEKYLDKLPLDLPPKSVYVEKINRKPLNKKIGKVAVIIPTKGNLDLLFNCINSFYEHCDKDKFDVFIADTGSTNEEKKWIKENIEGIKLLEYDYYNFAKINNEVVRSLPNDLYEFILFSNNDIKIMNDIITGMLSVFDKNKMVGTVGARLHFKDNTIQHDGMVIYLKKENSSFLISHLNLRNYYNYSTTTKEVIGNTGGLMMVRKNTFENKGMFNEKYNTCFEDVELNILLSSIGLKNYTCGECVSYHYESITRNEDKGKMTKEGYDYHNTLIPVVKQNIDKIKNNIIII